MTEKNITNRIIKRIHTTYPMSHVRKRLSTGATNTTGWPDITGHIAGIRVEIEVKQPGCKPTKIQRSKIRKFNKNNCIAIWCDSVESCIRKLDYRLSRWRSFY